MATIGDAKEPITIDKVASMLDIVDYVTDRASISPEFKQQVRHAAEHYFRLRILLDRTVGLKYSVAYMSFLALIFYDAYLAGLAQIKEPEPN